MDNLDPNFQSDQQSKRTPLHAAAQKGSVEICHVLLQVSTAAPAPRRPRTPACPARPVPATCPSLQAGANINAVDKQQRTPLMEAVVNNHLEAARYMVQRGGCVYSKVRCRAGPGAGGRGPEAGGHPRTHLPSPPGGGRLHLPPPRSQNRELGDGQPAAQHRTGGRQRPGQSPGRPSPRGPQLSPRLCPLSASADL